MYRRLATFACMALSLLLVVPSVNAKPRKKSPAVEPVAEEKVADSPDEQVAEEVPVVDDSKPSVVQLSSEQIMLNNEAASAVQSGDYKKAEQLFTAMLLIGEIDFVWLQLGRTYEFQGKCIEAADAYSHVRRAPSVVEQPRENVLAKLNDYEQVLQDKCTGSIVFDCRTPEMRITIDGGKEFECHSEPISLTPGAHSIYAQTSFGFSTMRAEASVGIPNHVRVEVIDYEKIAAEGGLTPEEKARKSVIYKAVGYSMIGVGALAGAGGGLLWGLKYNHYNDSLAKNKDNPQLKTYEDVEKEYDDTREMINISYGLVAGGGALLVTGIVLVVIDALKYHDSYVNYRAFDFAPQPFFTEDGGGVGMTFSF